MAMWGLPQLSVADGIPENGALSGVSTVKLQIRDREKTDILLREDEEPAYRTLLADTLKAAVKAGTDAGTVQLVLDIRFWQNGKWRQQRVLQNAITYGVCAN